MYELAHSPLFAPLHGLIPMIPVLPLLAAVWIALSYTFEGNRGEFGERLTARVALLAGALSLIILLLVDLLALLIGDAPWPNPVRRVAQ